MSDTTSIDPAVVHRATLTAEIRETEAEIAEYEKAAGVVRQQIASIEAKDLGPIVVAIDGMQRRLERLQAAADLAAYRALAPTEPGRKHIYEQARQDALIAYRRAQSTYLPSDKELVEKTYDAVHVPLQSMLRSVGGKLPSGVEITQEQVEATFLPRIRALRDRMLKLGGGYAPAAVEAN